MAKHLIPAKAFLFKPPTLLTELKRKKDTAESASHARESAEGNANAPSEASEWKGPEEIRGFRTEQKRGKDFLPSSTCSA